ncbi:MAG: hypothetical protein CSA33_01300 [Desulfobulbus propionicus]|nr:MAG: hypothetical protein CSA33_01300 [Desulfobulbus propionicus]
MQLGICHSYGTIVRGASFVEHGVAWDMQWFIADPGTGGVSVVIERSPVFLVNLFISFEKKYMQTNGCDVREWFHISTKGAPELPPG